MCGPTQQPCLRKLIVFYKDQNPCGTQLQRTLLAAAQSSRAQSQLTSQTPFNFLDSIFSYQFKVFVIMSEIK